MILHNVDGDIFDNADLGIRTSDSFLSVLIVSLQSTELLARGEYFHAKQL